LRPRNAPESSAGSRGRGTSLTTAAFRIRPIPHLSMFSSGRDSVPRRWRGFSGRTLTARLHVQRSRHLYDYGEPKTLSADRWVELFPETVRVLDSLRPLHWTPEIPVFTTTEGKPIEPKAFASRYWYACLLALSIRMRGIYCTK